MKHTVYDGVRALTMSIAEFVKEMDEDPYNWQFAAWPQSWSNTSCGFGGMAGQAVTTALTVVFFRGSTHVVFHNGRLARLVTCPNEEFYAALRSHRLPGAADDDAWIELESA